MIRFARLARDDRGASIVELALVVPIMGSLLIGMVDLSRAYSHKLKLEQAAQRAIEKIQQYQTSTSTYGTLQSEAAEAAGVPTTNVAIDYWFRLMLPALSHPCFRPKSTRERIRTGLSLCTASPE